MRIAVAFFLTACAFAQTPDIKRFLDAAQPEERAAQAALNEIARSWRDGYTPMFIDIAHLLSPLPGQPARNRTNGLIFQRLIRFLEQQTGQRFGTNLDRWRKWMWALPYEPHPDYLPFKGQMYANIDPRMSAFFAPGAKAAIRLDEIDWGGVPVNGIPPLVYPKTLRAAEAKYLGDGDIVFGLYANGEARAYPKRILAWHEMARDRVGGVEFTVVYCTLCGTVLPYESVAGGKLRVLGTSGLLFQSNKLMFDEETNSLWSTLEGKPVVGPLVGSGVTLKLRGAVTTTWGEWRRMHPATTVLSLDTGHKRDYSEGVAYRDYFASPELMFQVSKEDRRLANKAEVLVFHRGDGAGKKPVALSAEMLRRNPVFHYQGLVVLTSPKGANRVYDAGGRRFEQKWAGDVIRDTTGIEWRMSEDALVAVDGQQSPLERVAANRAFWFGWVAQFPATELVK